MWLTLVALWACSAPVAEPVAKETQAVGSAPQPVAAPVGAEAADAPVPDAVPVALPDLSRQPPEGFTDLAARVPGLQLQIAYHTPDNFTGAPLPGYGVPCAWLLNGPAEDLAAVQEDLAPQGLGLRVFDAYRPRRGTLAMVAWAQRTGQEHLLNGYIARVSQHNRGIAIDLTLVDLATGEPLDMGTEFDVLDERAHTRNATGAVLENRLKLVEAMAAHRWENYRHEWWHYTWQTDLRLPPRDVPCSCFEPAEGAWNEPTGWDQPGFQMPAAWTATACLGD
ncbi:MAG: hypothetical protein JXX28_05655 [Deltaproteobacteria bacterium]|nr:hypothetical protein [Deltaproteobacteria bacterium]